MKRLHLPTTTQLYLLTLLLIFGIIFLNKSAFAQTTEVSRSEKRLKIVEQYLSWLNTEEYGDYSSDLGKKALAEFKSFLSREVPAARDCLSIESPPNSSPLGGLFGKLWAGLTGASYVPENEQINNSLLECKKRLKDTYNLAKKYNRALKYFQIVEGKPNVCIKADLGIGKALKGSIPNGPTGAPEQSSVYICTDKDSKKILRVLDNSGKLLELSAEDSKRPELQIENLPPKESVDILIKKLGLITPSGEIFANPNPCIIPKGAQTCGEVEVEWDVSDETSDPVEVKTKSGKFIERSRNGSADILDIGPEGETFILYSLGRKIGEIFVKAIQQ